MAQEHKLGMLQISSRVQISTDSKENGESCPFSKRLPSPGKEDIDSFFFPGGRVNGALAMQLRPFSARQ